MTTIPPSGEACAPPHSVAAGLFARRRADQRHDGEGRRGDERQPVGDAERGGFRGNRLLAVGAAATGVAHDLVHDLALDLALADWSRNAFSPASDTSIHLWSGAASAT